MNQPADLTQARAITCCVPKNLACFTSEEFPLRVTSYYMIFKGDTPTQALERLQKYIQRQPQDALRDKALELVAGASILRGQREACPVHQPREEPADATR